MRTWSLLLICASVLASASVGFAAGPPKLQPGQKFTIAFPDMPRTYADQKTNNGKAPMMAVFLPTNYDPQHKHPLLIFLSGGAGSTGANPAVARAITEEKDFICVDLPLFKVDMEDVIIRDDDCKLIWSVYRQMLAKLTEVVPNIDPAHRILGGFSNGAHATGGLLDNSDGEAARWFTGFFFIEGGGRTQRYDLIKDKPLLICYGGQNGDRTRNRVKEFSTVAIDAGVKVTVHEMKDAGHAFPPAEYPFVRQWLHEVALQ